MKKNTVKSFINSGSFLISIFGNYIIGQEFNLIRYDPFEEYPVGTTS
jgi:hypothetical protein